MKIKFTVLESQQRDSLNGGTNREFFLLLKQAALLGLRDSGFITQRQHRLADESLYEKYRRKHGNNAWDD